MATQPELREAVLQKLNPDRFPNMSGKMRACVECALSMDRTTEPSLAELCKTVDGCLLGRETGDYGFNAFIGAWSDFRANWDRLLKAAELTDEEQVYANSALVFLGEVTSNVHH